MSSLRNAVQRRNHRERAQPTSRSKWGILEKHKDYSLRAADHNLKKRKIKDLKEKAATRNDDEFYFSMLSTSQGKDGRRNGDRGNRAMGLKEVTGLKRQDAAYLRNLLQVVRREIQRTEEEVQLLEGGDEGARIVTLRDERGRKGTHTVFVTDEDEQRHFSAEQWFGTDEQGLAKGFNRPRRVPEVMQDNEEENDQPQHFSRKKQLAAEEDAKEEKRNQRKRRHAQEVRVQRLELLRQQEKDIIDAENELEAQRARMAGTAASGVTKNGVKFKIRERKR